MTAAKKVKFTPRRERAQAIAARSIDAYSAPRYSSWSQVALALIGMDFNDAEAEAVMRSKITRWALDRAGIDDRAPARIVRDYLLYDFAQRGERRVRAEIAEWALENPV